MRRNGGIKKMCGASANEKNMLPHSRMLDEVFIQRPQCIKMSVSIDEADLRVPAGKLVIKIERARRMTEEKRSKRINASGS